MVAGQAGVGSLWAFTTVVGAAVVSAAPNSYLNQTITPGTLTTNILDASRVSVASPSVSMPSKNFSFECETVTGTLGSLTERIYVLNGKGDNAGWTLSLGAADGATAKWSNGDATPKTYSFNDPAGTGCTTGQLTVNPTPSTITADCSSCQSATVTKGASTAMTAATPVTLMTGAANAHIYRGYMTGVSLSQKVPAEQAPGSYTINMTLTAAAS